jgi:DNA polymerase-1
MKPLVIDLETSSLSGEEIWCVGFATDDAVWVVEWNTDTPSYIEALLSEGFDLVFHNAKFDVRVLREHGVNVPPRYWDTMVMSYVYNPRRDSHSLESWGNELGLQKLTELGVHGDMVWEWNSDTKSQITKYCKRDCEITLKLFHFLYERIRSNSRLYQLLVGVELPFVECIIEMESTGFYVDREASERLVAELTQEQQQIIQRITELCPYVPGDTFEYKKGYYTRKGVTVYNHCDLVEFNANSRDHIIYALMKLYGWKPERFTPASRNSKMLWQWLHDCGLIDTIPADNVGQPVVDAEVLQGLDYPITQLLIEHSALGKVRGMVEGYLERLGDDSRVRGSFNQTTTKTGRLSSNDPNLQNIPTSGELGHRVRSLFCTPSDDWVMVGCDLSNIEGRVLAHYLYQICGERRMHDTFSAGIDFHQSNADAWGVSRRDAKTLLYAICYGAGPSKVGGGDKERGLELMSTVDNNMPALKQLKELVFQYTRENKGVIYTAFGRRLYYPEINLKYAKKEARRMLGNDAPEGDIMRTAKGLVAEAERRVFNALLQGTAADVLKILVVKVYREVMPRYNAHLVANVHDEAIWYVDASEAEAFKSEIETIFSTPLLSHCPIKGEPKIGKSWADIH